MLRPCLVFVRRTFLTLFLPHSVHWCSCGNEVIRSESITLTSRNKPTAICIHTTPGNVLVQHLYRENSQETFHERKTNQERQRSYLLFPPAGDSEQNARVTQETTKLPSVTSWVFEFLSVFNLHFLLTPSHPPVWCSSVFRGRKTSGHSHLYFSLSEGMSIHKAKERYWGHDINKTHMAQ